jgi:hypothetical protein
MSLETGISRRPVLGVSVALGGLAMSGAVRAVCAQVFKQTPGQIFRFIPCSNRWIRMLI